MIIDNKNKEQTSQVQVLQEFAYTLDTSAEATGLIAETLRKSYKYNIKTPVQEYMSNARDVHRELGVIKAIDVQLPTELNPEFYIRDYGTGIGKDKIVNYITFAHSTKRKSNISTGGFGFGSKSFFAYADSFTIISFYQGVKYTYRASCVKSKEGGLVLLRETPTTEPDGLLVQIAVRPEDRILFKEAVIRLKTYWTDQEINILNLNKDEYKPEKELVDVFSNVKIWKSDEETNRYGRSGSSSLFLLVDNIPYSTDNLVFNNREVSNFLSNINRKYVLSISVPTGTIGVSKYREYIEPNPENIKVINELILKAIPESKDFINKNKPPVITNLTELSNTKFIDINYLFSNTVSLDFLIGDIKIEGQCSTSNNYGSEYVYSMTIPETSFIFSYLMKSNDSIRPSSNKIRTALQMSKNYKNNESDEQTYNLSFSPKELNTTVLHKDSDKVGLIQNQRIKTFLNAHNKHNLQVISSTNKTLSKFEQDLLNFFNIAKISSFERTLPVKQERISGSSSSYKSDKISKFNYVPFVMSPVIVKVNGEETTVVRSCRSAYPENKTFNNTTILLKTKGTTIPDYDSQVVEAFLFMGFNVFIVNEFNYNHLIKKDNIFDYDAHENSTWTLSKEQIQEVTKKLEFYHMKRKLNDDVFSTLHDFVDMSDVYESKAKFSILPPNEELLINNAFKLAKKSEVHSHGFIKFITTGTTIDNIKKIDEDAQRATKPIDKLIEKYYFVSLLDSCCHKRESTRLVLQRLLKEAPKTKKV